MVILKYNRVEGVYWKMKILKKFGIIAIIMVIGLVSYTSSAFAYSDTKRINLNDSLYTRYGYLSINDNGGSTIKVTYETANYRKEYVYIDIRRYNDRSGKWDLVETKSGWATGAYYDGTTKKYNLNRDFTGYAKKGLPIRVCARSSTISSWSGCTDQWMK